jgi:hypothetical protein
MAGVVARPSACIIYCYRHRGRPGRQGEGDIARGARRHANPGCRRVATVDHQTGAYLTVARSGIAQNGDHPALRTLHSHNCEILAAVGSRIDDPNLHPWRKRWPLGVIPSGALHVGDDHHTPRPGNSLLRPGQRRTIARRAEPRPERIDRGENGRAFGDGFDDERRTVVEAEKADERAGWGLLHRCARERARALESSRCAHAERRIHGDDRHNRTWTGMRGKIRSGERQREEKNRGDPRGEQQPLAKPLPARLLNRRAPQQMDRAEPDLGRSLPFDQMQHDRHGGRQGA